MCAPLWSWGGHLSSQDGPLLWPYLCIHCTASLLVARKHYGWRDCYVLLYPSQYYILFLIYFTVYVFIDTPQHLPLRKCFYTQKRVELWGCSYVLYYDIYLDTSFIIIIFYLFIYCHMTYELTIPYIFVMCWLFYTFMNLTVLCYEYVYRWWHLSIDPFIWIVLLLCILYLFILLINCISFIHTSQPLH